MELVEVMMEVETKEGIFMIISQGENYIRYIDIIRVFLLCDYLCFEPINC